MIPRSCKAKQFKKLTFPKTLRTKIAELNTVIGGLICAAVLGHPEQHDILLPHPHCVELWRWAHSCSKASSHLGGPQLHLLQYSEALMEGDPRKKFGHSAAAPSIGTLLSSGFLSFGTDLQHGVCFVQAFCSLVSEYLRSHGDTGWV